MRIHSGLAGIFLVLPGIGLASAPRARAAPVYSVTDLGTNFAVEGMNNAGQLVGVRSVGNGPATPVLYTGGQFTDLPAGTRPIGITDGGQVINSTPGWTSKYGPLDRNRTEYGATTMANGQGYQVGDSSDYNWRNYGIITTHSYVRGPSADDGTPGGRAYSGIPPQDFGSPNSPIAGSTSITAINNVGQVAGNYQGWWNDPQHAFLGQISTDPLAGTGPSHIPPPGVDLGTLGGKTSWAYGLNDKDEVVGQSLTADGTTHAFVYRDGKMIDLGGGPSTWLRALAINNKGEIVGELDTLKPNPFDPASQTTDERFGVLWKDGQMIKLNDLLPSGSGWRIDSAVRITDAGQILAYGMHDGESGLVLLTPFPPDATPVPEPGTLALFGLIAGATVLRTRRRVQAGR